MSSGTNPVYRSIITPKSIGLTAQIRRPHPDDDEAAKTYFDPTGRAVLVRQHAWDGKGLWYDAFPTNLRVVLVENRLIVMEDPLTAGEWFARVRELESQFGR